MNKAAVKEFEICCGKDIKPDDWLWVQYHQPPLRA